MFVGFWSVEVAGVPPEKYHIQLVAVVLKSVKLIQAPSQIIVSLEEKSATGAAHVVTVI